MKKDAPPGNGCHLEWLREFGQQRYLGSVDQLQRVDRRLQRVVTIRK